MTHRQEQFENLIYTDENRNHFEMVGVKYFDFEKRQYVLTKEKGYILSMMKFFKYYYHYLKSCII